MKLDEQQQKLLARIACDSPQRGDGQEFIKLLSVLEIDALKSSKTPADVDSRWMQGQAMGYERLQKEFKEASKL